ncbi:MAG: hypothetical protein QF682_09955, partial [Candidatus Thermoplasmatota archaeon]|nr:hypothetical protein [Candidatus Thermoplasmatota archaeon]
RLINEIKAEINAVENTAVDEPISDEELPDIQPTDTVADIAGVASEKKLIAEISSEVKALVLAEYSHVLDLGEFVRERFQEKARMKGMNAKQYLDFCFSFYEENRETIPKLREEIEAKSVLIMIAFDDLNARTREDELLDRALNRVMKWEIAGAPITDTDKNAVICAGIF